MINYTFLKALATANSNTQKRSVIFILLMNSDWEIFDRPIPQECRFITHFNENRELIETV